MENHTSASMYIPSSRVLARLQRHSSTSPSVPAAASAAPPLPAPHTSDRGASSSSAEDGRNGGAAKSRHCAATTSTSNQVADTPCCSRSVPAAAAAATVSVVPLAPLGTPYYPTRSSATQQPPKAAAAAVEEATNNNDKNVREGAGQGSTEVSAPPAATDTDAAAAAAAAAPATSSTWLLPREDVAYLFSTLTWNVDLLRLLLPHAPCPLKLPSGEADASSSRTSASRTSGSNGKTEEKDALQEEEEKTGSCGGSATAASSVTISKPKSEEQVRNEEEEGEQEAPQPPLACSVEAKAAETRSGSSVQASLSLPGHADPLSALPPPPAQASPATPQLTWSQHLFRSNQPSRTTPNSSPASGAAAAAGVLSVPTLALPRSPGDGGLARPAAAAAPAASSTPAATNSIFHAHYLPSLKEFQRDLEAQRQHQQQQQQQQHSTLSAMRLEQHLQAQQQQQQQRRRRAVANRTFFYSPTPSVVSLATTAAVLDEEGDERVASQLQTTPSVHSRSTVATHGGRSMRGRSYAAAVIAAATAAVTTSARSSPAPSVSTTPSLLPSLRRSQQSLAARRLRPRVSSSASLELLAASEHEGDGKEAFPTSALRAASSACFFNRGDNNFGGGGASLSASFSSRPSLLQQQPSAMMMMRAADRLRASIVSTARDATCAAGPNARQTLHKNNSNFMNSSSLCSAVAGRRQPKDGCRGSAVDDVDSNDTASSCSRDEDDGVPWLQSHTSSAVNESASSPGSPVASVSSVSFARMWSSALSGRATPRSSVGITMANNNNNASSSFNAAHGDALLAMSVSGYGERRGGGGSRRKKKYLRRQKSSRTCRQRAMRVYVPSITEGPKAATLYSAPTAEAQELLMQLQRRAATTTTTTMASASNGNAALRTPYLPAAPIVSNATSSDVLRTAGLSKSPSLQAGEAPLLPSPLRTSSTLMSRPAAVASAEGNVSSRSGNEQHAIRSSLLHAVTEDTIAASAQPQQRQHDEKKVAGGRGSYSRASTPANTYLAAARGSLSSASFTSLPRPSGQWPAAAAPPIIPSESGSCDESLLSATASSLDEMQRGRHRDGGESGGECCDRASLDGSGAAAAQHAATAAAVVRTPVELPNWVRERSLSALYYQPWGLELLARYEQQQQQLRRLHHQQQQQQTRAAGEGGQALSHAGSASTAASSVSPMLSPAITPKLSASFTSASATSPAASATSAPRRPPVLTRASLGTTNAAAAAAAAATTATTAAAAAPRVSWAAALRHHPTSSATATAGVALPTTNTTSSRITATTTMTNAMTTTTTTKTISPRAEQQQQQHLRPRGPPSAVPEWPPELAAAEELDAQEEAFYFFGLNSAPASSQPLSASPTTSSSHNCTNRKSGVGDGVLASTSLLGTPAPHGEGDGVPPHQRSHDWGINDLLHLPTLYLSRQKRSRRRLRACPDDSTTTRSSAARKVSATSAAAELQSKRASAPAAAEQQQEAEEKRISEGAPGGVGVGDEVAAVATAGSERPSLSPSSSITPTTTTSKEDLWLFGDNYRRKKTAQLYYPPPPPPTSWPAPRGVRQGTQPAGQTAAMTAAAARAPPAAAPAVSEAEENHLGTAAVAFDEEAAPVEDTGAPTTIAEAAARLLLPSPWPAAPLANTGESAAPEQQQDEQQQQRLTVTAAAASRESSKEAAAADDGNASPAAATATAAALASSSSHPSPQQRQHRQSAPIVPEVDINFFLQKFLRAVLIVVVTQVRLQQRQRQQHAVSCPAGAYGAESGVPSFTAFVGSPPQGHDTSAMAGLLHDAGAYAVSRDSNGGASLSAVERHALSFVRHHMHDYRAIMTAYVMRDDKEVARRSAQSIFADNEPGFAARGRPPSSLFDYRVCHACLRAARVNDVYEATVAAEGNTSNGTRTDTDAAGSAALDDVEAMHTSQLYIGGKDAAWQPLLLELLQVTRLVQCYGEGPVVLPAAATASNTPQQHLLASLETFVAQPTVPLLRTTTINAAAKGEGHLTPVQAAAAAQMTEASDAFRHYLLSGYLSDPATQHTAAPSADRSGGIVDASPAAAVQRPERPVRSLLQPLVWYPYAYMPGTANPYAENTDPSRTSITPAQAASASAMSLFVATLPLSGRLVWKWIIPAEDTDTFNLSVFFQSSLFSFMQGGAVPMPTTLPTTGVSVGPLSGPPLPPLHPSALWPPAVAAAIDARLHADAWSNAWGGCSFSRCTCGGGSGGHAQGTVEEEHVEGEGEVVLVHCSAGMHRSCGILVAFLLWLLYQCRQVMEAEKQLGWRRAAAAAREDALIAPADVDVVNSDEEEEGKAAMVVAAPPASLLCGVGDVAVAPTAGDPLVTSRVLQRCIHHVQSRRSIAVPIRTVQSLLQSFANELQLS